MWGNAQVSYKAGAVEFSERDGRREEREEKKAGERVGE